MARIGSTIALVTGTNAASLNQLIGGVVIALSAVVVVLSQAASSQTVKTVKIIVPATPGGAGDTLARLLGERIGRAQGVTVLIENRAGAGGVIGAEAVSRAAPDGSTVLMAAPDLLTSPHLRMSNYDLLTLEPICDLVSSPQLILVNKGSPFRTLADLLDAARAKPGEFTLAGFGPATTTQIAFEMLKRAAGVEMTFLPYPGGAPAINALLGEHVTSVLTQYSSASEQLRAGNLRALATVTRTRIESLPEVPTVAETGYKDYEMDYWLGTLAPAKTPKETVSQLAGWFTSALQAPELRAKLAPLGLYPAGVCGPEFGALIRKQYDEFGRVIREASMKAE
jgi:tripartite-type tricarboxylate transporter receptor subunit TctC